MLRQGLARLADEAVPRPSAADVARRLRRRAIRRNAQRIGMAAAAIVIVAVGVRLWSANGHGTASGSGQTTLVQATVRPLPIEAAGTKIERAVREYLASVGVRGEAVVIKDATGDLSFSLAGNAMVPLEQLRADLTALLRNYETVRIEQQVGTLRYMMMASRAMGRGAPPVGCWEMSEARAPCGSRGIPWRRPRAARRQAPPADRCRRYNVARHGGP